MSDHKYRLTYKLTPHPDGIERPHISEDLGACDCVVMHSILGIPGGGTELSVKIISLNGTTGKPLTPQQLFLIWEMMAHDLARYPAVHDDVKTALLGRLYDNQGTQTGRLSVTRPNLSAEPRVDQKRFLVFAGLRHQTLGGMADYLAQFDTRAEAMTALSELLKDRGLDDPDDGWVHLWDTYGGPEAITKIPSHEIR